MSEKIVFEATTLPAGKKGILKRDGSYREIVLGAFNAFNASGHYYSYTENSRLAEIFRNSSDFMRRVQAGQLYGEYDHPRVDPKMTRQELFLRRLTVDPDRTAAHIRRVWLVPDAVEDIKGRKCLAVIGEVAPAGPFGKYLEESFENPHENTAFSIRCFTKDTPINGVLTKSICELVTWDFVGVGAEPGIKCATKYSTPSLESFDLSNRSYSQRDLSNIVSSIENKPNDGYSQETASRALNTAKDLMSQTVISACKDTKIFNW